MIEIKNVSESYVKGVKVIDNISLNIEDGKVFGFIGPNRSWEDNYYRNDYRNFGY